MKRVKDKKLSLIRSKVAKLNNPNLVLGGDGGLTTETKNKEKFKCVNNSREWVPVIEDN